MIDSYFYLSIFVYILINAIIILFLIGINKYLIHFMNYKYCQLLIVTVLCSPFFVKTDFGNFIVIPSFFALISIPEKDELNSYYLLLPTMLVIFLVGFLILKSNKKNKLKSCEQNID